MSESRDININQKQVGCGCGSCCHSHSHAHEQEENSKEKIPFLGPAISFALLLAGMIMDHFHDYLMDENPWIRPLWYFIAFIPVGFPVLKEALEGLMKKDYFNELTLMTIACVGAFLIGEYSEAVGVMLFYSIGETLQNKAVDKATRDISKLLDIKAETARVVENDDFIIKDPDDVAVGEVIEIRPGERVPLDGIMLSDSGMFDTAALTGESVPREIEKGNEVLAGMISSSSTLRIKVSRPHDDSALSRILDMVKNAQTKKAHSEVFIRKFARIYTPVVTLLALLVVVVPFLISLLAPGFHYVFTEWLYRALVFLVISCPCALVISVPLSYFAGIGAASKYGVLFKGGNYLETIKNINTVAFDKTGTLTTGEFKVEKIISTNLPQEVLLSYMAASESASSHPLAKAIVKYVEDAGIHIPHISTMEEKPGKGTIVSIGDMNVMTGNLKLLKEQGIPYPEELNLSPSTIVACAVNNLFQGYVILSDTLKPDSKETVSRLHSLGVDNVVMLSGDRKEIVKKFATQLNINDYHGEMLPQDKAEFVEKIAATPGKRIVFVGDGMNDAPVLALSNVGVAMGALGSDAAIESADVVIQTDNPSRVATAIEIGRYTHKIVNQNIIGAIGIKVLVLALGLTGIATLWAAVFADVGVTLLAVLNSMRILWKKYK